MGLADWFRRRFSSSRPDDEAAEREEYGLAERGESGLERERLGPLAASEGAEAAEAEVDQFKAPPDPAP